MFDVCFYEAFSEEASELRRMLPASITAAYTDRTIQEADHASPIARIISIRTQSQIPPSWAEELDAILSRSTGYDHLLAYAAAVGEDCPALGYLPLYCHRAVAEQAILMCLALLRRLPRQLHHFRHFDRDGLTGSECQGRRLVVVGVGYIGYEVCQIAAALGMRVQGVDLEQKYEDIDYVDAPSAFADADVVVCAMNLTDDNRGYFDLSMLRQFKPGAIFVNVSRGELSPSTVLLQALEAGYLSGVGLDVYDQEAQLALALRSGKTSTDPQVQAAIALSRRDDCLCTPHNAFNSSEAVTRKSEHSVQQIVAYLENGAFLWSPTDDTGSCWDHG